MKVKQIRIDGYKNLIDCIVDIGDFNILVGPNNSGKSNFLEAIQMLWPICFGDDKIRGYIFRGANPRFIGSSVCHLEHYPVRPLSIGVTFHIEIGGDWWIVDYDVKIQFGYPEKDDAKFMHERLSAKIPGTPGPAKTYINRMDGELIVCNNSHKIAKRNPSLLAIRSLYADYEDLPPELRFFSRALRVLSNTNVFALSPTSLRSDLREETTMDKTYVSSFDLLPAIENIQKEPDKYSLFENEICEILDIENIRFVVRTVDVPTKDQTKEATKDYKFFLLQRTGSDYSLIDEFSDGTLLVVATLACLLSSQPELSPLLCLEELENCLHPNAVEKLLNFLQSYSEKQPVLITTHSPYVLNCLKNPDDLNIAVVDEYGATHFEKIQNISKLKRKLNTGLMNFGDLLPSNFAEFLVR